MTGLVKVFVGISVGIFVGMENIPGIHTCSPREANRE